MLKSQSAPMQELSEAKAVFIEAPAITKARYEQDMLELVSKVQKLHKDVVLLVQPSLRRKSNRTLWVHKWNNHRQVPFKFKQTCSCKLGNTVKGCHFTCMIGSTRELRLDGCNEVPTFCGTSQSALKSLSGTVSGLLTHFCLISGCTRSVLRREGH